MLHLLLSRGFAMACGLAIGEEICRTFPNRPRWADRLAFVVMLSVWGLSYAAASAYGRWVEDCCFWAAWWIGADRDRWIRRGKWLSRLLGAKSRALRDRLLAALPKPKLVPTPEGAPT